MKIDMIEYKGQSEIANKIREYYYSQFEDYKLRAAGVYGFRNKITNQTYIGSAGSTFKQRWNEHIYLLTKLRHHNGFLLESWRNHTYEDFEFVILEIAEHDDSREDIYLKEEQYIKSYVRNNKKLYNIALNSNASRLKMEYKDSVGGAKTIELNEKILNQFESLLNETFYDSTIYALIMENVVDGADFNAKHIALLVDEITASKYEGIKAFLNRVGSAKSETVNWVYGTLDMCECNLIGCMHYDSMSQRCKLYDEDLTEQWYKPIWCETFREEYDLDPDKYDKNGRLRRNMG